MPFFHAYLNLINRGICQLNPCGLRQTQDAFMATIKPTVYLFLPSPLTYFCLYK
jgi:hypothetical protein